MHECEGPTRLNSRPRRYIFTGHSNGSIQLWDLTTALELKQSDQTALGGPTPHELAKLLDRCDLIATCSGYSTPTMSNCISPSLSNSNITSIQNMSSHFRFQKQHNNQEQSSTTASLFSEWNEEQSTCEKN